MRHFRLPVLQQRVHGGVSVGMCERGDREGETPVPPGALWCLWPIPRPCGRESPARTDAKFVAEFKAHGFDDRREAVEAGVSAILHQVFVRDDLAVFHADSPLKTRWSPGGSRPGVIRAFEGDGDHWTARAFDEHGCSSLERLHRSIARARAFRKDEHRVPGLEPAQDFLHGREVGTIFGDGYRVEPPNDAAESANVEESLPRDVVKLPLPDAHANQGRIEIGLVISDEEDRPGGGHVASSVASGPEEQRDRDDEDAMTDDIERSLKDDRRGVTLCAVIASHGVASWDGDAFADVTFEHIHDLVKRHRGGVDADGVFRAGQRTIDA